MVRSALTRALVALLLLGGAAPAPGIETRCTGDCDQDARIDIADLIVAVRVVLGEASLAECPSIACTFDHSTSVACVVAAVEAAQRGDCQPPVLEYQFCGKVVCDLGEVCCNPLYGICTLPGEYCIQ
ncbi:MAG TPA: hypothetical protein VL049_20895 [Candidatus Dormibacteraeota bacterium]|nr:hypothetical protein [Candidatus Dormibacteraeota bacterium]